MFGFRCKLLDNSSGQLKTVSIKEIREPIVLGRGLETAINDLRISRKAVEITLCSDPQTFSPVLKVIKLGTTEVKIRNPGDQHETVLTQNQVNSLYPKGTLTLKAPGISFQYKFEAVEYTIRELKQKEVKLQQKLHQIRQIITNKQHSLQKCQYTGYKRNYQAIIPPNKQQKMGGEYSVADVIRTCEYGAILTYKLPEGYNIIKHGPTDLEIELEKAHQNMCDCDYEFWCGELPPKSSVGFQKPKSWFGVGQTFVPLDLITVDNVSFQFSAFSSSGKLQDKRAKDTTFLPFMHWILQLKLPEETGARVMAKLCETFIDPRVTKFPDTQVIAIVNQIFMTCKNDDGTFSYLPKALGLLVVLLFHIFSVFQAFGAPVKIKEEGTSVYRALIQFLFSHAKTLENLYPELQPNKENDNQVTDSPVQFVVRNLDPVVCEEETLGMKDGILNPIPTYARF